MSHLIPIAVAVVAGLLMTRVFKKLGLNLPDVTAFLIAGLAIGPYGLGRLGVDGMGFVSMEAVEAVSVLSQVALGFIAFSIGNEFRLEDLKHTGRQAAVIGVFQALAATLFVYSDHIEVKVYSGKSSLRRKLTKCNNLPIASISSGLPLKGEDKVVNFEAIKTEKGIRTLIKRNLRKEIHPGTKPSIDFIFKILDDAYNSDLCYDVSDMKPAVLSFGASSTHQADYCIKLVSKMQFKSKEPANAAMDDGAKMIFYDVEVFPNLFLVNWKFEGEDQKVVRMINPKPAQIEELMKFRLVGFNCRRYDNHIMYARMMGYSNEQLYKLSQKIITEGQGFFGEAYNLSYTDVYDFAAKKQSLKKWEIELGIHHQELGLPWDQPVPEERWIEVAEYCDNDVIATEAVFNELKGDFIARKILADLAGMTVNDTTNSLTTRIIFGKERHPKLVYTDLATGEQFY